MPAIPAIKWRAASGLEGTRKDEILFFYLIGAEHRNMLEISNTAVVFQSFLMFSYFRSFGSVTGTTFHRAS